MRVAFRKLLLLAVLLGFPSQYCPGSGNVWAAQPQVQPLREDMAAFIDEMVARHGLQRRHLNQLFGSVQMRPSIIRAMSAPGTSRPWHEFRRNHIDEIRIASGVKFWRENAATLQRAAAQFGVPAEIIVATIGIETLYGKHAGTFRVIDALSTLAFDYPLRAEFFRSELEAFLLLTRENRMDPLKLRGSFAGAMGIPQFMPSSYRKYAIDFNGNGRSDLLNDAADAIGSVANYYRQFGWETDAQVVVPVDAGQTPVDVMIKAGIKPHTPAAELLRSGIIPMEPVADDALAALIVLETEGGARYWLALQNFYVITRYNRSLNYAMAVYELARAIRSRMPGGA